MKPNHFVASNFWVFLIIFVVALSIAREPLFFISPRIWAEEGTVYMASVLENGPWLSLIIPHLGYYSLFNNFVIAFGLEFFGLNGLAYVTTLASFAIILATVFAPLVLKSPYWDTKEKKALLVVYILIIGPGEIWLNTINSQFYFCVFASLLLLSDTRSITGWKTHYVLFLVLNGALTGVTTIVLVPFFLIKYLKGDRANWKDAAIFWVLIFGVLIQVSAFVYLLVNNEPSRFDIANISHFPKGFANSIRSVATNKAINIAIFPFVIVCLYYSFKEKPERFFLPIFLALYLSALFTFLSLGMNGGGRYSFAVSVLFFISMLEALFSKKITSARVASGVFFVIFLVGTVLFFRTNHIYGPAWIKYSTDNAIVGSNDSRVLILFPQGSNTHWEINLTQHQINKYR